MKSILAQGTIYYWIVALVYLMAYKIIYPMKVFWHGMSVLKRHEAIQFQNHFFIDSDKENVVFTIEKYCLKRSNSDARFNEKVYRKYTTGK